MLTTMICRPNIGTKYIKSISENIIKGRLKIFPLIFIKKPRKTQNEFAGINFVSDHFTGQKDGKPYF